MEIFRGMDYHLENSAVSLGKFDGVHLGHRLLVDEIKRQKNFIPTIFTFETDKNDREGGKSPMPSRLIYSQEEKNVLFGRLGVKRVVLFPFDEETRNMAPEFFIREILIKKIGASLICVGEDFCFGKERRGNVGMLKKYSHEFGYDIKIFHKLTSKMEVVSSTLIREKLHAGELERANELLGEPYFIMGEVLHGNELGRTLGMPTANLLSKTDKVLPPAGVYVTSTLVDGKWHPSVTNIGNKPTVGKYQMGIETCILNYKNEIYGKQIHVRFHKFIRREKKFPGLLELKSQMERDKAVAASWHQGIRIN